MSEAAIINGKESEKDVTTWVATDVGTIDAVENSEPDVPEGGYGWVCVLASFMVNMFTWGAATQSFGVFLGYYLSSDLFPDASAIDYAFIGGFNLSWAMIVAPLVTVSVRLLGTKPTMLIGVLFETAGFVLASFTNAIWQLYITQGAMVGIGIGFTYIPSTAIVSQYFRKRRNFAVALTTTASGFGGILFSFSTDSLINKLSVGWALRFIGILSGVMNIVATIIIKDRNKEIKPTLAAFDVKLLRQLQPVLLLLWVFAINFGYTCLLYSLPDFALSIGLTTRQATLVSVWMNVATAIGRSLVGLLSDYYGVIPVTTFFTLYTGVATFAIWIPTNSYGLLVFFALATGGTLGVVWPAIAPLCAKIAGLRQLPSMLSLSWLAGVLPLTFAEVIALKLRRYDSDMPYLYPQIFAGLSYIVSFILLGALYLVHRKQGPIS